MKHPHIPLYTGDWIKDSQLSLCTPATRGVWIDLLCAMHECNRSGELRGTSEQLARLARCSTVELENAFTDLQTTGAAIVDKRNGTWVIANRRMKREAETRVKRAEAGSKGGSQAQANREQNPDIDNANGLERVREFARGEGILTKDADWFYWKGRGNGWTNGGKPILDWKATLRSWYRAGYLPSQKAEKQGINGTRPMSAFEIEKRINAIKDERAAIRKRQKRIPAYGNGVESIDDKIVWNDDDKTKFEELGARRDELKRQLVQ